MEFLTTVDVFIAVAAMELTFDVPSAIPLNTEHCSAFWDVISKLSEENHLPWGEMSEYIALH